MLNSNNWVCTSWAIVWLKVEEAKDGRETVSGGLEHVLCWLFLFLLNTYFDFMGGDFVSPFAGGIVIAVVSG